MTRTNEKNNRPEYASVDSLDQTNEIKVGDRVRSFDSEFKPFSWEVGTVIGFEEHQGCMRCVIAVDFDQTCRDDNGIHDHVVETEDLRGEGRVIYPPANGTRMIGGMYKYTNFVEKVA